MGKRAEGAELELQAAEGPVGPWGKEVKEDIVDHQGNQAPRVILALTVHKACRV